MFYRSYVSSAARRRAVTSSVTSARVVLGPRGHNCLRSARCSRGVCGCVRTMSVVCVSTTAHIQRGNATAQSSSEGLKGRVARGCCVASGYFAGSLLQRRCRRGVDTPQRSACVSPDTAGTARPVAAMPARTGQKETTEPLSQHTGAIPSGRLHHGSALALVAWNMVMGIAPWALSGQSLALRLLALQ